MIKAALFAKLREWHTEFGKWGYKTTKKNKHGEDAICREEKRLRS